MKPCIKNNGFLLCKRKELNQFQRNKIWEHTLRYNSKHIIDTKWMFKNKLGENGIIIRNKARLVAQGYNQEEVIGFDETFALVLKLESIRLLLSYACSLNF